MTNGFAVIPDGADRPAALFYSLDHAMDWGLLTYRGGAFRIRIVRVVTRERQDPDASRH